MYKQHDPERSEPRTDSMNPEDFVRLKEREALTQGKGSARSGSELTHDPQSETRCVDQMEDEDKMQSENLPEASEDLIKNNINEFNGKELNIEFNRLKELYKFYGTKSFPPSLKINESKPTINNKRIRKYKLVKVM